jgi:hypothetical protein
MTLELEAPLDIVSVCTMLGIGDRTSVNAAHRRWIDEQSADPISSIPKLRARASSGSTKPAKGALCLSPMDIEIFREGMTSMSVGISLREFGSKQKYHDGIIHP